MKAFKIFLSMDSGIQFRVISKHDFVSRQGYLNWILVSQNTTSSVFFFFFFFVEVI